MTSGNDVISWLRSATLALLVIGASLVAARAERVAEPPRSGLAQPWGVAQLMADLRQVRSAAANFVEEKQVRVLSQTLRSSGRLLYVAPDRLVKETIEPSPARLTVDGDRLVIEAAGESVRELSLSEYPELGALIGGIRWTLAGDLAALSRAFALTLSGSARSWTLALEPRDSRLRDLVTAIRIHGAGNAIHGIETLEADGDRGDMTIVADRP